MNGGPLWKVPFCNACSNLPFYNVLQCTSTKYRTIEIVTDIGGRCTASPIRPVKYVNSWNLQLPETVRFPREKMAKVSINIQLLRIGLVISVKTGSMGQE